MTFCFSLWHWSLRLSLLPMRAQHDRSPDVSHTHTHTITYTHNVYTQRSCFYRGIHTNTRRPPLHRDFCDNHCPVQFKIPPSTNYPELWRVSLPCVTQRGGSQLLEEESVGVDWCPGQPVFKLIKSVSAHCPWHQTVTHLFWLCSCCIVPLLLSVPLSLSLSLSIWWSSEAGCQGSPHLPHSALIPLLISLFLLGKLINESIYVCASGLLSDPQAFWPRLCFPVGPQDFSVYPSIASANLLPYGNEHSDIQCTKTYNVTADIEITL